MSGFQNPSDAEIVDLLNKAKTIALLGASANPERASHEVMAFLQRNGHRVIPVNPGLAGQTLLGEKVYGHLDEIKEKIDLVDVFRASEYLADIVSECIVSKVSAIWTQLDVVDDIAAAKAKDAGIVVVMNKCPKIEYPRLGIKGPG